MRVRSLGYRTDLMFAAFDGQVVDRGDYLVVRTPSNPSFYWGNFLLFRHPPSPGDDQRWRERFADEIGRPLAASHETFGWDGSEESSGVIQPFLDAGFGLIRARVLQSTRVQPPAHTLALEVRPLEGEHEWRQALELQVLCREEIHGEAAYRMYRQRAMDRYRRMEQAGWGHWYGAFQDGDLVGDLGIFHHDGLARYQSVETHPALRRRGVAGTLVYEAGRAALSSSGVTALTLVADADSPAERLYRSVGFEPVEYQMGLERWDTDT
jgi:GNAT superfamily N-acetyltransferase